MNVEYLDRYIKYLTKKEMSEKTILNYKYEIENFIKYIDSKNAIEIKKNDIENYLQLAFDKGNKESRRRFIKASISSFYTFLIEKEGILKVNPTDDIKIRKDIIKISNKNTLDKEQVKSLLFHTECLQETVFIALIINTLAPVDFIRSVLWRNIKWNKNMLIIEDGEEKRVYYITEQCKELLNKLRLDRRKKNIKQKYVFLSRYNGHWNNITHVTANQWIKKIGDKSNISNLKYMDIKQSTIRLLTNEYNVDILDLNNLMKNNYLEDKDKIYEIYRKYNVKFYHLFTKKAGIKDD